MMINQTIGQQKVLQEAQDMYQRAWSSPVRQAYLSQYLKNLRFFYGDQWTPEHKREITESGGIPFVVNRIEPIVTTYTSLQINARRRISISETTDIRRHQELAGYLDNLIYSIQQQNDFQNKSTQKYVDALIGGLGWTHFGYEAGSYQPFFYDSVDPREMAWDPDDRSQRLDSSEYNCRRYYVSLNNLNRRYPKFSSYFEDMVANQTNNYINSPIDNGRYNSFYLDDNIDDYTNSDLWTKGRAISIVEVYYKKNAKYFETEISFQDDNPESDINEIEQYFSTFDESLANKKKAPGAAIKEIEGTQIWKAVFCDQVLLESGPIPNQIPNQRSLPITPLCLKRNYKDVPYGVVDGLIDLSIALNYIWTKTIYGLDSKLLILEKDTSFDKDKEAKIIYDEMGKKRGVIFVKDAKNVTLSNNETLLPYLFQSLQRVDVEFEQRTQLFDELKGDQTNAVSGVAIQQRALNAARTQNPLNATYEYMLKTEGQLMLDTIKGINDFKYTFNYFKDDKVNYAKIDNEISTINFEVYTDSSANLSSSNEEEMAKFEALLDKPNYNVVLSNPLYLKKLGFTESDAESLSKAFIEMQQQAMNPEEQN